MAKINTVLDATEFLRIGWLGIWQGRPDAHGRDENIYERVLYKYLSQHYTGV